LDTAPLHALDIEHDLAVVEQQCVARVHIAGQSLVGAADLGAVAGVGIEHGIERKGRALGQVHAALGKALDANLGTGQVRQDRDVAVLRTGRLAHRAHVRTVRVGGAMREVDARHIQARLDHRGDHTRALGRRPQSCDYLCAAPGIHRASACSARSCNIATAGSVLPSTNSRKAPPPVEMYEMPSATPYFSMAANVSPPPASENAGDLAMAC